MHSSISGSRNTRKGSAVSWEAGLLNDVNEAGRILRQITACRPVDRETLAAFKSDCAKQFWATSRWKSCREKKAYQFLSKTFGIKLRKRSKVAHVQERNETILAKIGPVIAWLRKNSTHSKGSYSTRTFGFRRQMIEEALNRKDLCESLVNPETGEVPTVTQVERIMREHGWKVDPRNEPDDFVQQTIGWRPRFAGDVILADWTGLPLKIDGEVFEVVNKRKGKKERRFKKFGLHVACDAATNFTWVDHTYGDSEYDSWPRFLEWMLFEGLGYRPNFLVMDKVSGVVTSLLNGSPDEKSPSVMAEILAWVAAGVTLHVHTPERANAKGHVERVAGLAKHREWNALTVRACLEQHMRGSLVKPREAISQAQALRMIGEIQGNANKRVLSRDGTRLGPRFELWDNAEDVVRREERALSPNARHEWREIVSRAKLVWVAGKTAFMRANGKKHIAEIGGFEEAGIRCDGEDATAWIVPPLPGVGVDPEEYRVCLIQDGKGLPKFHALTARISKKDRFAFDEVRPFFGAGYHAKPATKSERTKSTIDFAAQTYAKSVTARQATTDEEDVEVRAV